MFEITNILCVSLKINDCCSEKTEIIINKERYVEGCLLLHKFEKNVKQTITNNFGMRNQRIFVYLIIFVFLNLK